MAAALSDIGALEWEGENARWVRHHGCPALCGGNHDGRGRIFLFSRPLVGAGRLRESRRRIGASSA